MTLLDRLHVARLWGLGSSSRGLTECLYVAGLWPEWLPRERESLSGWIRRITDFYVDRRWK